MEDALRELLTPLSPSVVAHFLASQLRDGATSELPLPEPLLPSAPAPAGEEYWAVVLESVAGRLLSYWAAHSSTRRKYVLLLLPAREARELVSAMNRFVSFTVVGAPVPRIEEETSWILGAAPRLLVLETYADAVLDPPWSQAKEQASLEDALDLAACALTP